jgi:hypothetical protein
LVRISPVGLIIKPEPVPSAGETRKNQSSRYTTDVIFTVASRAFL